MIILDDVRAILSDLRKRMARYLLSHRMRARHPTLNCDPTVIWNYPWNRPDAIEIGRNVTVMAHAELLAFPHSRFGTREGHLVLGDDVVITTGVNIRAAGGAIMVGAGTGIGQYTVLVAVNHQVAPGVRYINSPWDESRSGVTIGSNVWVGAMCVLLPGCQVGDNAVIAAGSVVRGAVPASEVWGGVPARRLRAVGDHD